ncbi:hypothetical protein DSO57_1009499 [Entomophthora muscae]|uniref:Uncharacterized protein n=1 Tax=Entomophthora muscae TaxID=34485 RepID=A0ACC2USD7_9FUNG|nr:hypothetical protein DSO57_1009499 [Entomophthora muscae]
MIGVPIFFGSNSKWKAASITAAASFITQLLGATFAYLLFKVYWNSIIAGVLFLFAASILINTVFSGMLPLARQYDPEDKYCTIWLCTGVAAFIVLTSIVHEDSVCH